MGSSKERENSQAEPPPTATYTTTYPMHPPPQPMYCPTPHGYPQYPNGYPPGYYPQTVPYYGPPPTYHTSSAGSRCCRSFVVCSCMILTCLFLMTLALALVLHPQLPLYQVASLSVTNFSTTPTLAGEWDAKITIENPNDKLVAYFSHLKVDVAYKDGVVAVNHAPGFVLNTKEKVDMDAKGSSNAANGDMVRKATMDELVKEKGTGTVTFTLWVSSTNMFKSASVSTRSEEIVAVCEELKVVFQNNDSGTLDNKGKPNECHVKSSSVTLPTEKIS
ncbi:hypothetical protein Fmac_027384 [Flemingia macrophylla]|uniref:Late embryogenesis abundant protein LEA-2 subgroup domain-containing protein n=1 Tax=Flemingia macrophylla TaxID=520843 RepID=A0ABD1LHI9_9FABA